MPKANFKNIIQHSRTKLLLKCSFILAVLLFAFNEGQDEWKNQRHFSRKPSLLLYPAKKALFAASPGRSRTRQAICQRDV